MTRIRWTPETVLDSIRARHVAGRPLNYQAVVNDDEALTGAARLYYGSWDAALSAAGYDPVAIKAEARSSADRDRLPAGTWTEETILDTIREAARQGQDLSAHRMQQRYSSLVATAQRLFGGWDDALRAAGYAPELIRRVRSWTDDEVVTEIRRLSGEGADLSDRTVAAYSQQLYGAAIEHYGSWAAALEAAGVADVRRTAVWSRSRVLEALRDGRRDGTIRSLAQRKFGTMSEALRQAGVPEDEPAQLGNRILERREALGLSQAELGRRLGYSHTAIRYLEQGKWADPRVSVALKLARALGCGVGDLFG